MKKLFFLLFVGLVSLSVSAQSNKYTVGTNAILGGFGLGSDLASGGFTYGSQSPALSLQYERGLWEAGPGVISLGLYVGNKSYTYDYGYLGNPYNYKLSYTTVGVRGAYHFTGLDVDNLDLYGGAMLAYEAGSFTDNEPGYTGAAYGSKVDLGIYVGGRYYFSSHVGVFAELGYSVAILNLGLVVKW